MKIEPHKIQQEALLALEKTRTESKNKALSVLPSGMGKTLLAAFDTKNANAKRILYIAHRREILEQAESVFRNIYGFEDDSEYTGFVISEKKEFERPMLFATIQTLYRPDTLNEIAKIPFDYVIIDEYHHAAAMTYQKVLDSLQMKFLHGLTATPYRLDGKNILDSIDNNITYTMDLEAGIKSGELVPFYYHALYDNIDYSDIKWQGYRYKEKDLNKKLIIDKRDNQILKEYKRSIQATGRRCMMFCVSVKHTDRMTAKLKRERIRAEALTYATHPRQRHQIVADFRAGKIDVLCIRDIFNEGVDFPEVSAIMFLRPTLSRTVFYQQLGRGLRKAEGKKDVLVFDFVSNYHNAYRIKEWLSFATPTGTKSYINKPEYRHNVGLVYFDQKVLDIFQLQRRYTAANTITREDLVEEYQRISKAVGFNPSSEAFQRRNLFESKYGIFPKYSCFLYNSQFGSWRNFLQAMNNSQPYIAISEDWIKHAYETLASKLKRRFITEVDWREEYNRYGLQFIQKRLGGFRSLRKLMNFNRTGELDSKCQWCNKPFMRFSVKHAFCSSDCLNESTKFRNRQPTLDRIYKCRHCKTEFTRRKVGLFSRVSQISYCSDGCRKEGGKDRQRERYHRSKSGNIK